MQREDQYQEYVKKLKKAQLDNSPDQTLKQLSEKADYMLSFMKEYMSPSKYTSLIWLLMIVLLLVSISSFLRFGSVWRFLPLVLSVVYVLLIRMKITQLLKEHSFDTLKEDESLDSSRYVEGKVSYVMNGVKIKRQRIKQVMYFYMLAVPFLLFFSYELISGSVPFNNVWTGLGIAFIVGSYIWTLPFSDDLDELNYYESSLQSDLQILHQSV